MDSIGLGIFWNNGTNVYSMGYSSSHIDVFVSLTNYVCFRFIGFYGNPKPEVRYFPRDFLFRLHSTRFY